jgi:hypothetical protein
MRNLDSCRCWRCRLCPCKVRNKFLVNFWNRAILVCIHCILSIIDFCKSFVPFRKQVAHCRPNKTNLLGGAFVALRENTSDNCWTWSRAIFCNCNAINQRFRTKRSGWSHAARGPRVMTPALAILFARISIVLTSTGRWLTHAGGKWRLQQYVAKREASTAVIQIIHGTPFHTQNMNSKCFSAYWILNKVFAAQWGVTGLETTCSSLCSPVCNSTASAVWYRKPACVRS